MISSKSNIAELLAVAALAAASSGVSITAMQAPKTTTRRLRQADDSVWQKKIAERGLTVEQREWNASVEAKRRAKKAIFK